MALTLDSSYTAPDPAGHMAGQAIRGIYAPSPAFQWDTLGQAANYILARCHAKPVICQAWNDSLVQQTSAVNTRACTWRIPRLTDAHTEVKVSVRCERAGASGNVRFQSTEGADTLDLAAPAAEGWVQGTLDVDFNGDGYETIEMLVSGDGTDETTVHSVTVQWSELSTLPASWSSPTTAYSLDDAQFHGDEPLTSAAVRHYLFALNNALARKQVYWNWSGVENSTNAEASHQMGNYPHRVMLPMLRSDETFLNVSVYGEGTAGSVTDVRVYYDFTEAGRLFDASLDSSERPNQYIRATFSDGEAIGWKTTADGDFDNELRITRTRDEYRHIIIAPYDGHAKTYSVLIDG